MAPVSPPVRTASGVRRGGALIFVTVGTHEAPFDRLVQRMDELAGWTEEPVWMQIGSARVSPVRASHRRFFPTAEYRRLFRESRAVVSHAGVGTLLEASRIRKPLVCLPRLHRFGEHWDDHQLEICAELARSGTLQYVEKPEDLDLVAVANARPPVFPDASTRLGDRISSFLREAEAKRRAVGADL